MAFRYHSGELSVQERAGVREMADRIGRSIGSTIPPRAQDFLKSQPLVVIGSVDPGGQVWASLLTGVPGFVQVLDEENVRIQAQTATGDPLNDNLAANAAVGLIAIDFATRRRMRLNGLAKVGLDGAIHIHAQQVYSNCPKYIQPRQWRDSEPKNALIPVVERQEVLALDQQRWIGAADTFFIATHHPGGGTDASHRGGPPGFVLVLNHQRLVWPDYAGNTMFQTLGNIEVNPSAGLLFIDFEKARTLQITGRARVLWDEKNIAEFAGAERVVEFNVDEVIQTSNVHSLEWRLTGRS